MGVDLVSQLTCEAVNLPIETTTAVTGLRDNERHTDNPWWQFLSGNDLMLSKHHQLSW